MVMTGGWLVYYCFTHIIAKYNATSTAIPESKPLLQNVGKKHQSRVSPGGSMPFTSKTERTKRGFLGCASQEFALERGEKEFILAVYHTWNIIDGINTVRLIQ